MKEPEAPHKPRIEHVRSRYPLLPIATSLLEKYGESFDDNESYFKCIPHFKRVEQLRYMHIEPSKISEVVISQRAGQNETRPTGFLLRKKQPISIPPQTSIEFRVHEYIRDEDKAKFSYVVSFEFNGPEPIRQLISQQVEYQKPDGILIESHILRSEPANDLAMSEAIGLLNQLSNPRESASSI